MSKGIRGREICSVDECGVFVYAYGHCKKHYRRWQSTGDPLGLKTTEPGAPCAWVERQFADQRDRSDHWLDWPYFINKQGYPTLSRWHKAGHYVLELDGRPQPAPPNHHMRHACDIPRCLSPGCLLWGSNSDNVADRVRRGRSSGGSLPGALSPNTKFTVEQVAEIRERYASGGVLQRELAAEFGVGQQAISRILTHKRWQ